jgi:hypothetical protein
MNEPVRHDSGTSEIQFIDAQIPKTIGDRTMGSVSCSPVAQHTVNMMTSFTSSRQLGSDLGLRKVFLSPCYSILAASSRVWSGLTILFYRLLEQASRSFCAYTGDAGNNTQH